MTQALNMALLGNNVNTSGQVLLASGVSGVLPVANGGTGGTLPVANGGTGANTLPANSVLVGNGTSALQSVAPGTSGNVLRSNGTAWVSTTIAEYDGVNFQTFVSSGTFTVPAGITAIKVTVRGGGGGGAQSVLNASCQDVPGGNGGFGGFSAGFLTVTPGASYTVTIGAGGAGSNSGSGSAGGASSFGTAFTTTGGGGGLANNIDGANGTGSGTNLNLMIAPPDSVYRTRATSSTAAVAFAIGTARYPGAGGQGESTTSGNNAGGGVGGAVLVEW